MFFIQWQLYSASSNVFTFGLVQCCLPYHGQTSSLPPAFEFIHSVFLCFVNASSKDTKFSNFRFENRKRINILIRSEIHPMTFYEISRTPNKNCWKLLMKIHEYNYSYVQGAIAKNLTPAQWLSVGGILLFFCFFLGALKKLFGGGQFFFRPDCSQKSNLHSPKVWELSDKNCSVQKAKTPQKQ